MDDYKERLRDEYIVTKIRYEKLHRIIIKFEADTLDFTPTCSISLLRDQARAMGEYLHILEVRAEIEHIKIPSFLDLDFDKE